MEDMDGKIEAVVDGGPCRVGVESTILDLTVQPPRLLRPGGLPLEELEQVCGAVEIDKAVVALLKPGEHPKAPGMKYRHYAPKAPVTVVTGDADCAAEYILDHIAPGGGVICFDEFAPLFAHYTVERLGSVFDKAEQAAGCSTPCAFLTIPAFRRSGPSARTRRGWAGRWLTA